jgi:hypothetical protein
VNAGLYNSLFSFESLLAQGLLMRFLELGLQMLARRQKCCVLLGVMGAAIGC